MKNVAIAQTRAIIVESIQWEDIALQLRIGGDIWTTTTYRGKRVESDTSTTIPILNKKGFWPSTETVSVLGQKTFLTFL